MAHYAWGIPDLRLEGQKVEVMVDGGRWYICKDGERITPNYHLIMEPVVVEDKLLFFATRGDTYYLVCDGTEHILGRRVGVAWKRVDNSHAVAIARDGHEAKEVTVAL